MPELPEVETMVRGIRPHVVGREIEAVKRCRCRYKPISIEPGFRRISVKTRGQRITDVRRLAKRVVLELSTGDAFVIEPRMTGLMLLSDPPDRGHLRMSWHFAQASAYNTLWFWDRRGLGTVRLFSAAEMDATLGADTLGPDALDMSESQWRQRLKRTARAIKVVLLDQRVVAGIGNLYANEILHRAGIHPALSASTLDRNQVRRLCRSAGRILRDAIRYEGSTLGDGTYRNALNQNGRYQNVHRVYNRAQQTCRTCGEAEVVRIVQAQRSTFFCPVCQS